MAKSLSARAQLVALRREGRVAWSSLATRASILAGVAVALLCMGDNMTSVMSSGSLLRPGEADGMFTWGSEYQPVLIVFLGTSLAALACGIGSVVLQTRGVFGPRVMLAQQKELRGRSPMRGILSVLLVAGMGIALARWSLPRVYELLRWPDSLLSVVEIQRIGTQICKLVIVGGVVLAILSAVLYRFLFLLSYARRERGGRES